MSRDFPGSATNDLSLASSSIWQPSGAFAVAAWVYRDSSVETAAVSKWDATVNRSFILYIPTNNIVNVALLHNTATGSSATKSGFTNSAWHHIGFEFTGAIGAGRYLRVYLDGVAGSDATPPNSRIQPGAVTVYIGSSQSDGTKRYWDGAICDVATWSSTLSAAEWGAMAKGVPAGKIRPASLLSYMPIWGVGSGEPDLTGGGSNFTVNGTLNPRNHGPVGPIVPI